MVVKRHVTRVADADEDALEALYEKRLRKKAALLKEKGEREAEGVEVDPVVDALPVKTLDGQLYYRTRGFAVLVSASIDVHHVSC